MIKRIYVHNFRSLVNFEVEPSQLALLMGSNGSGKSSLLDVLDKVRRFVADGERLEQVFPATDFTRASGMEADNEIRIELDIEGPEPERLYQYKLAVQYNLGEGKQRVWHEALRYQGKTLFELVKGEAHLYRDDGTAGPVFPMDWTQSGVGFLMSSNDNKRLTWFKQRISRIWVVRINPFAMSAESRREIDKPKIDMSDFADWYRRLVQISFDAVQQSTEQLRDRLPGFRLLRLDAAGDARVLRAEFCDKELYHFSSLSEGQRALIALYSIVNGLADSQGATLCIDEPENFLALPEIQPWLDHLQDFVEERQLQAFLISHHPRLVNFLASGYGYWLERDNGVGPTRCKRIGPSETDAPIKMDDLLERGWINNS